MRLLIIGASGYLGREIHRQAEAAGHKVIGTRFSSKDEGGLMPLDIRDYEAVAAGIDNADVAADAVINAAYAQTDWATTAVGPAHISAVTGAVGARLVHISSDAVFGGDLEVYDESCDPSPTTPYGAAKAAAEVAVASNDRFAAIVRTSWILGDGMSGFESFVRALARGEAEGVLFDDDVRAPVHVADLAAAALELAAQPAYEGYAGVLHVAGSDAVSRYELGCLLVERDGLDLGALPKASKSSIGSKGTAVVLDSTKAGAMLAANLRGAREFTASNPT